MDFSTSTRRSGTGHLWVGQPRAQPRRLRPVPQWLGSNAWVLSGDRTKSGEVLFCNDAHIAYASPSVWYEAHVVTPELEYYGNHIGGLPFPVIGHTRGHAWGITMFVNDDIDLYRDPRWRPLPPWGEWLPVNVRTETLMWLGNRLSHSRSRDPPRPAH